MNNLALEKYLSDLLKADAIKDFCPNGLQVQGKKNIQNIVTGVTACQALIDQAIEKKADALLVHHGFFWKNESPTITGMKYNRIKALIEHDINLLAYHLPLDVHPELGNNAQLAKRLSIEVTGLVEEHNLFSVVMKGQLQKPMAGNKFAQLISQQLQRECLHIPAFSNKEIKTVAWCTGGGQNYIALAAEQGIDAFITGEASEQTTHVANEMDIHFFAAGHHATERYGAKALGEYLAQQFSLNVEFVDINNPV